MPSKDISVIGAGLAGSECALQLANHGINVTLYEMKPKKHTPAQKLDTYAELVCSNSMKSSSLENASGLLKEEMRRLGCALLKIADECAVDAGKALAVDRVKFSETVTAALKSHPNITVIEEEVTSLEPDHITIMCTGPLTSAALYENLKTLTGTDHLYFHDAISPIVSSESLNFDKIFHGSRYDETNTDYLNAPMDRETYTNFVTALTTAEVFQSKEFDDIKHFQSCMPVEAIAKTGPKSLSFGPMRPVGLHFNGIKPHAVVQLRKEDQAGNMYNLVGFQTRLTIPEQKRLFQMIPGLENAEFYRYGSMHRNAFIHSPKLMSSQFHLKAYPNIYIAGQLLGGEGYVESMMTGMMAAQSVIYRLNNQVFTIPPLTTAIGSILNYVFNYSGKDFQPMNINFGLFQNAPAVKNKDQKIRMIVDQALSDIDRWKL